MEMLLIFTFYFIHFILYILRDVGCDVRKKQKNNIGTHRGLGVCNGGAHDAI